MNGNPARRVLHQGNPPFHPAPNAALLIDFDNVTMAIRSDLGKELKALLNSEVIRGKVAVQRAYADWRRYPQYIVPLAESSVDLIFAPAYGSSKKNATDLRMAIDAIELVFTRPEIGTFILLTGDSDFSSCVLKLKEYGKYVIGVGMRESSSDLLIQNCDEYYSYHSLSGLTREGDVVESKEDPWVLVRRAAEQMSANRDAMRTDRLKQVMLDLDPAFDEKKLGYSKFSRFASEAAKKGMIRLQKLENGQHEILLAGAVTEAARPAPERSAEPTRERSRDRRGRRREAPAPIRQEPATAVVAESPAEAAPARAAPAEEVAAGAVATDLQTAYALLQQAVRALAEGNGGVRDGDVKRRMLEIASDFDESNYGFPKFSRFLRQAHDDAIVDLERVGNSQYQVSLSPRGPRLAPLQAAAAPAASAATTEESSEPAESIQPVETAAEPAAPPARTAVAGARRGRRGRGAPEGPPPLLPGQVVSPPVVEAQAPATRAAEDTAPAAEAATVEVQPEEATAAPAPRARRGRRGRGRAAPEGPPELLPGQIVEAPVAAAMAAAEQEATSEPKPDTAPKRGRGRGRKKAAATEGTVTAATSGTETASAQAAGWDPAALNLPTGADSVRAYLTNSYRGIGQKTADMLVDALGSDLFRVMQEQPERVREVLGDRRANTLLEQWTQDYQRRAEVQAATPAATVAGDGEAAEDEGAEKPRGRPRGRRGGRGRGRQPKEEPAPA